MNYLLEFDRMFPCRSDNDGILNIDLSMVDIPKCYSLPILEFGLLTCRPLDFPQNDSLSNYTFKNVKLNHRYSDKNYLTLSRTKKRQICKIGYPICESIDALNSYKTFVLRFGFNKCMSKIMLIPINIELTKEQPLGSLVCTIHDVNSNSFGVDLRTFFREEGKPNYCVYVIDTPQYDRRLRDMLRLCGKKHDAMRFEGVPVDVSIYYDEVDIMSQKLDDSCILTDYS